MKTRPACLLLFALFIPFGVYAESALSSFNKLKSAGLLVIGIDGQPAVSVHADKPLIPASTTKLATAWLALTHWGEEHRFRTLFYLDESTRTLWIKGSGDPYLVSEELELIAVNLTRLGLRQIHAIGLDTSLFDLKLVLPGTGETDNPYDAVPSAVAANFNTVNIKKINGRIFSAEPQTPLTATAKSLSRTMKSGTLRVNTGPNPRSAENHFAELLAAFLRKQNVKVGERIIYGRIPKQPVFYTHVNRRTLAEIIQAMLEYSTNFVANQLILMLSAEAYQRPSNATDVKRYLEENLSGRFHWTGFTLEDGAGLSRNNRLSPKQLVDLLLAFGDWKHLLPEIEPGIYAKSGTLNGISTLAGYLVDEQVWKPFALMMNEKVPYDLRNRIARELAVNN